jgi:hypothetical protein
MKVTRAPPLIQWEQLTDNEYVAYYQGWEVTRIDVLGRKVPCYEAISKYGHVMSTNWNTIKETIYLSMQMKLFDG